MVIATSHSESSIEVNDRSYMIPDVGARTSRAKQRLMDAALLEFARAGYAGASIRSMTRLLGMRESGFYAHFSSKQAAYDALFEEAGSTIAIRSVAQLSREDTPETALHKLGEEIMVTWSAPRARLLSSIALRELFGARNDKRQQLLGAIDDTKDTLGAIFAGWQKRGVIRSGPTPTALAFEFLAPLVMLRILYFNQASTMDELREGDILVARHVESFLDLVLLKRL